MNDFLKEHRPRMTDDEDRRVWERVRAIPGAARARTGARSRWRSLFALPAVQYGLPALAVVVAAVVWVADRAPEPPAGGLAERVVVAPAPEEAGEEVREPTAANRAPISIGTPAPDGGAVRRTARAPGLAQPSVRATEDAPQTAPTAGKTARDEAAPQEGARESATLRQRGGERAVREEAAPAPPPAAEAPTAATEGQLRLQEKRAAESKDSGAPGSTFGRVQNLYRSDAGAPAAGFVAAREALARGRLPAPGTIRVEDFVAAVVSPGRGWIEAGPGPLGSDFVIAVAPNASGFLRALGDPNIVVRLRIAGGAGVAFFALSAGELRAGRYELVPESGAGWSRIEEHDAAPSYTGASARFQRAALAVEFARALRDPERTPRSAVVTLARRAREGAGDDQGDTGLAGLAGMLEDAVGIWPSP